jgi:hypothetical protein
MNADVRQARQSLHIARIDTNAGSKLDSYDAVSPSVALRPLIACCLQAPYRVNSSSNYPMTFFGHAEREKSYFPSAF